MEKERVERTVESNSNERSRESSSNQRRRRQLFPSTPNTESNSRRRRYRSPPESLDDDENQSIVEITSSRKKVDLTGRNCSRKNIRISTYRVGAYDRTG